jgi:hypothetical protein
MAEEEKKPVKVRGGEARKVVELDPNKPKSGQVKYDPNTKHIYVFVEE